jgi:hypothetical protein
MDVRRAGAVKKGPAIGLPVYIAGAVFLVGAVIFGILEWRGSKPVEEAPLSDDAKAYVHDRHLQLEDVTMKATESYVKQNLVEIEGKIGNAGDRPVSLVEVYCYFYDTSGQRVYHPRVAIVNTGMGGLKPGETKSFRLPFDEVPQSWNQLMPQLVIAAVKFS